MSIAIQRSTGQIIYFDAVKSYKISLPSKVTNHPVDGAIGNSSSITDNVILENKVYTISGIISDCDFNTDPLRNLSGSITFVNSTPVVDWVEVSDVEASLLNLFPSSVTQFMGKPSPRLTGPDARPFLQKVVKDALENIRLTKEIVNIIEETNGQLTDEIKSCILTQISYDENADTGDALYIDITAEQINFVELVTTKVTKVASGSKDKASPQSDKGNQTATQPDKEKTLIRKILQSNETGAVDDVESIVKFFRLK